MKIAVLIARIILGLVFFVFGLNGFFQFIPVPPMEGDALTFMTGLKVSGYFFPLLKSVEVLGGIILLTGLFLPLGLVILLPITLNIFFFHLCLAPEGLPMAIVMLGLHLFLAWAYRGYYKTLLSKKAVLD